MRDRVDCVVIGAGVVGLAAAKTLAEAGREVLVLEAAGQIGTGTSSRNSEVIHAGIYYSPGSLKARLCVAGRQLLYRYCEDRFIPHARCGKVIVGSEAQRPQLDRILQGALASGVTDLRRVERDELRALEPAVAADCALLSPSTGIVDSHALMLALQSDLEAAGSMVAFHVPVTGGRVEADGIVLEVGGASPMTLQATTIVNAAGLDAQVVARKVMGADADIPDQHLAIGHYYTYSGQSPFGRLVYPVPEEGGLGVHATLDLGGQVKFGPDVRWIDAVDYRFDDSRRQAFADTIRGYYPDLDIDRLQPGYTGIRPKLSGPGEPAADFRIDAVAGGRFINLYGIESPGLTSSLAIGRQVAELCRL